LHLLSINELVGKYTLIIRFHWSDFIRFLVC